MYSTFLVMAGGALGAASRYHLGRAASTYLGYNFPSGTLIANVMGGFAMGVLAGWLTHLDDSFEPWRLLLGVGFLGGFTTFSAFSLETFNMIERGQFGPALGYAVISVLGSVFALFLGMFLIRQLA